jgi:hypothetical protein
VAKEPEPKPAEPPKTLSDAAKRVQDLEMELELDLDNLNLDENLDGFVSTLKS